MDRVRAQLDDEPGVTERKMLGGVVVVSPEGVETDEQLGAWVARGSDVARSLPPKELRAARAAARSARARRRGGR